METFARKKTKNDIQGKKTMNEIQIKNFIMYYERLTKHMLKNLKGKFDFIINIDKKHQLKSMKIN